MASSGCTSTSTPGLTFALSDPFTSTDSCQISGYSDDPDIWLLFQTICIYPANSDELSISTRWQDGHYPVNPDGAGASRIHSLTRTQSHYLQYASQSRQPTNRNPANTQSRQPHNPANHNPAQSRQSTTHSQKSRLTIHKPATTLAEISLVEKHAGAGMQHPPPPPQHTRTA